MPSWMRGDTVWAKMGGFPWWPAIVIDSKDCGRDDYNNEEKLWIFWFGDNKVSQMPLDKINDFKKEYNTHFLNGKGKRFIRAVQEALTVLAENCNENSLKSSNLFDWAAKGFENQGLFLPEKEKGLPKMVSESLNREEFKRKLINDSDQEDDSDEDTLEMENLLPDVLNGIKNLEDICISCFKPSACVVKKHPYFVGGFCETCQRIVEITCDIPFGELQDFCAVCGQGGHLIICSNSMCLKSFCSLCIEYMTPKGTFKKVLRATIWLCYLCELDSKGKCLILPRRQVTSHQNVVIPSLRKKALINVLAHSDTILTVLKSKRFAIGKFSTEIPPLDSSKFVKFNKFIEDELEELSPDFVCCSYLEDPFNLELPNEDIDLLFKTFYSFLYTLDEAKVVNERVLFAFLLNAKISNYLIQERLSHLLEVPPVALTTKRKSMYLWSNILNCSCLSKVFQEQNFADVSSESDFFVPVIELLSKYFKCVK